MKAIGLNLAVGITAMLLVGMPAAINAQPQQQEEQKQQEDQKQKQRKALEQQHGQQQQDQQRQQQEFLSSEVHPALQSQEAPSAHPVLFGNDTPAIL